MKRLAGKKALVSGSGTGIGKGIGLRFAAEGADVVFHYSHSGDGARQAAAEAAAHGVRTEVIQADFNSIDEATSLGRKAVEFLGGLDILVNNVGITMNKPFQEVTPEQFDTLYNVNIRAMFFLTQTCLAALIESQGAVINLTSVHAFEGMNEHSVYAGTKGAIVAYTRQLAIELAQRRVRVNAVAPGAIVVENHYKAIEGYDPEVIAEVIPCGFEGVPNDIASVATFLATDEARYIIGQTLIVDGGTTSWMPFNSGFKEPAGGRFGQGYVPGV